MSREEFDALARGAAVLSRDRFGPKVLLLPDRRVIKLFRRKRLVSSTLVRPYAARFAAASHRLKQLEIPAVEVSAAYRIRSIARDAVVYFYMDGSPLREVVQDSSERDAALERLARFLTRLHDTGVYFRGIHFGNVLVRPDGGLALIDLSEARFAYGSIGLSRRVRNFRPLVRYPEDAAAIAAFGGRRWLDSYCATTHLDARRRARLRSRVMRRHPVLAQENPTNAPALESAR